VKLQGFSFGRERAAAQEKILSATWSPQLAPSGTSPRRLASSARILLARAGVGQNPGPGKASVLAGERRTSPARSSRRQCQAPSLPRSEPQWRLPCARRPPRARCLPATTPSRAGTSRQVVARAPHVGSRMWWPPPHKSGSAAISHTGMPPVCSAKDEALTPHSRYLPSQHRHGTAPASSSSRQAGPAEQNGHGPNSPHPALCSGDIASSRQTSGGHSREGKTSNKELG
jgi:hypothetical protein